jgi:hypothetical protein
MGYGQDYFGHSGLIFGFSQCWLLTAASKNIVLVLSFFWSNLLVRVKSNFQGESVLFSGWRKY